MHLSLLELRNKVCLAYWLMNALFVTIVYVLTEVNESNNQALSIKLPCRVSAEPHGRVYIEPISFTFTVIFGVTLLIQFVCLLFHRFSTFIHIVAANTYGLKNKITANLNTKKNQQLADIGVDDGLIMVKKLQAVKEEDEVFLASEKTSLSENSLENKRREMWERYTRRLRAQTSQQPQDLRTQFAKNLNKLTKVLDEGDNNGTNNPNYSNQDNEDEDDKVTMVLKTFRNRLDRKTVKALAQNKERTSEIKRRAMALNRRNIVKSRWQAFGEKNKLTQAVSDINQSRHSKFAFVAAAVMAEEKRKVLEGNGVRSEEETPIEMVEGANKWPDMNEEASSSGHQLHRISNTDKEDVQGEEIEMQNSTPDKTVEATNF